MNPHFHTDFSISDSLIFVRKSVLIYETIIKKDGKYYVDLTGILLADYSKSFTINVNGKAFVTCSVNDYCNKVLNSKNSSNKLSDLVTAIYELGTASK